MAKQILTADRNVFIHDFDGVHYDYDLYKPTIYAFCDPIKGEVGRMLLPFLSETRAPKIGHQSYHRTGDGLSYFVKIAGKMGLDVTDFAGKISAEYHKLQRIRSMEMFPHIFAPCENTNAVLDRLAETDIRHGLLTQSCLVNWAVPQLTELGRIKFFEPTALLGFAEVGYVTKKESVEPLRTAMTRLDAKPENTVFIEDNLDNIETSKKLDERILTVHISHEKTFKSLPDSVDLSVKNVGVLFNMVAQLRKIEVPFIEPRPQAEMAFTL